MVNRTLDEFISEVTQDIKNSDKFYNKVKSWKSSKQRTIYTVGDTLNHRLMIRPVRVCTDCKYSSKIREKRKVETLSRKKEKYVYETEYEYIHCYKIKEILSMNLDAVNSGNNELGKPVRVNKYFAHICTLFTPRSKS